MSTTLADLRSQLVDWLATDTTRLPVLRQNAIINEAQRRILRTHDLTFAETQETLSTVANQEAYALSGFTNVFSRPILFYYVDPTSGNVTEMDEVTDTPTFVRRYKSTDVLPSAPMEYNIFGGSIYLGPIPDAVYSIVCNFMRYFADLSVDSDHNDLTDKAPELVLYRALLMATDFEIEDQRVQLWQARYDSALSEVLGEHARVRSSGRRIRTSEPG